MGPGDTLPMACQDWANTEAAYCFLSNERVSEREILAGHFRSTAERMREQKGPLLILHDTTEFSFQRVKGEELGVLHRKVTGRTLNGIACTRTLCGVQLHSSLAVTVEGLPLGLAAVKFWTRKKFKGCNALKRKINPTRVPIEQKESLRWLENLRQATALSQRGQDCVHIADREGDIFELFCAAQQAQTHFLICTCVNRLAGDGGHTVADTMRKAPVRGRHRITVEDEDRKPCEAILEIKCERLRVLPPIGKQKRYPALELTVIHATERKTPAKRPKVDWKLVTDLPGESIKSAVEKLEWYSQRWKIETFQKILKSGCKVEESKLRAAERLANLLAVCCILSWRIFWMTMVQRINPEASPKTALTAVEIHLLDTLVADKPTAKATPFTISRYVLQIAKLGGYLARTNDPPPGNIVMCGVYPGSLIFCGASQSAQNLWVIESAVGRLHSTDIHRGWGCGHDFRCAGWWLPGSSRRCGRAKDVKSVSTYGRPVFALRRFR